MGDKKEKSGKKKGPLRKLSKIFSFKGSKHAGKGNGNEASLKEGHSESSVTNTPQSENSASKVYEQRTDAANVSGHSESYSNSRFHIGCDTVDIKESPISKNELPSVLESFKNVQQPSSNNSKDTNLHPQESYATNYPCEDKNKKFERFTVTAVLEEGNVQDDSIDETHSGDSEAGIKPKTTGNEQDKTVICHPKSNSFKHANDIEIQISQSGFTSDEFVNTGTHLECHIPQSKLNIVETKKEDTANHENHSSYEQINFVDEHLPDKQLSETLQTCKKQVNEQHILKDVEFAQDLGNHDTFNDHSSQPKTHNVNTSSCISSISDNHIKVNALKSSYCSDECGNTADENHSHMETCQNDVHFAHHRHHVLKQTDEMNIEEGDPGSQNFQHNHSNHGSSTDTSAVEQSDPSMYKSNSNSNSGDHVNYVAPEDKLEVSSEVKNSESQGESLTCSDSFTFNRSNTEVLETKIENHKTNNYELRDAQDIKKSLNGLYTSNLGDHSSDSDLNQTSLDKFKTATFDDEGSNIDSEDEPPELTLISQIENNHNEFTFISHGNDNSQILHEFKEDHVNVQSNNKNDDQQYASKHNYESFSNNDRGQVVENYPSTKLIKETPISGTKSYLPRLTSPEENRKSLDLKTNGKSEATFDKSSDSWKQETQSHEPKGDCAKEEDTISVQRTPSSTNSIKHSRLPVRKSLGSENIADKISRLSAEIEELSTGVKQKSDNKSRSNIPTPARSKIPRKYVNNSPLLHSK